MTGNQVMYAQHLETKRHNLQTEKLGFSSLGETTRHNQATEQIGWFQSTEQARHNRGVESINWYQNETQRAAVNADAAYKSGQLVLGTVSAAQNATKIAQENWNRQYSNYTDRLNAMTNRINASTRKDELGEQKRHNTVNESIDRGKLFTDAIWKGSQAALNIASIFK